MIEQKAAMIRLLLLDVDGVMTDGHIMMNDRGEEIKSFDVRDGQGLKMLMAGGIEVVLVTGRRSLTLGHRAEDLGIKEVYQGVSDKRTLCRQLVMEKGVKKEEICCIGDDLPDLSMFSEAGLCIAVADAVSEVRESADFSTTRNGGAGAVREVCELILKSQGKWDDVVKALTGK